MPKQLLTTIIISLMIAGGLTLVWYWQTDPERQIEKTLTAMAELGSSPAGESSIAKTLKTRRLIEYFSDNAFIEWPGDEVIPAGRWTGREQISQQVLVLAAKNSANYSVSLTDLTIEVKRRPAGAGAQFTLVVREGLDTWAWLAEADLAKIERRWLVSQLIFKPILRP